MALAEALLVFTYKVLFEVRDGSLKSVPSSTSMFLIHKVSILLKTHEKPL